MPQWGRPGVLAELQPERRVIGSTAVGLAISNLQWEGTYGLPWAEREDSVHQRCLGHWRATVGALPALQLQSPVSTKSNPVSVVSGSLVREDLNPTHSTSAALTRSALPVTGLLLFACSLATGPALQSQPGPFAATAFDPINPISLLVPSLTH